MQRVNRDEVPGLQPEKPILVRELYQLGIAGAPGSLVGNKRQVRISLFAVPTNFH